MKYFVVLLLVSISVNAQENEKKETNSKGLKIAQLIDKSVIPGG